MKCLTKIIWHLGIPGLSLFITFRRDVSDTIHIFLFCGIFVVWYGLLSNFVNFYLWSFGPTNFFWCFDWHGIYIIYLNLFFVQHHLRSFNYFCYICTEYLIFNAFYIFPIGLFNKSTQVLTVFFLVHYYW